MKEVRFTINYGGFIGTDDEYSVYVDDDATPEEIEDAVEEEFLDLIRDNCSWELIEDDEDEEDEEE